MEHVTRLDQWFAERLHGLRYERETCAYVTGVLADFRHNTENNLSKRSIVLTFDEAQQRGDFAAFQRIGDWVLWVSVVQPQHIVNVKDVAESFGRLSYYRCHRIMRGQWRVYEQLADELPYIVADVQCKLAMAQVTI